MAWARAPGAACAKLTSVSFVETSKRVNVNAIGPIARDWDGKYIPAKCVLDMCGRDARALGLDGTVMFNR
jgi:hypothetical protein